MFCASMFDITFKLWFCETKSQLILTITSLLVLLVETLDKISELMFSFFLVCDTIKNEVMLWLLIHSVLSKIKY
jgi:hypothetical protein